MKLPVALRKLYLNDLWLLRVLLAFMVLCYGVILRKVGVHWPLNRTFNSMLDHLVHWRFDVDPNIVGREGFLRNGHVYSYWGITCALVRLPLLFFHRLDLDVTAWSCLVAVYLAGMMKVRTVLFLRRCCGPTTASEGAFVLMLAYIVLGGAEISYLKSSTYQEVVLWAIAFAAVFVYFAVKGLVSGQFTVVILSWMALAAGLATLTRVSTGIGLCAAFGLLLLVLLLEELRAGRALFTRRFLVPAMVLAAFLIVVGTVNYQRWGNPATFADYTLQMNFNRDQVLQIERYGLFNLARVPFGLTYYFLPLPALQGANGFFDNTQTRLMFAAELPPSSFFLTDLLPHRLHRLSGNGLIAGTPHSSAKGAKGSAIRPVHEPTAVVPDFLSCPRACTGCRTGPALRPHAHVHLYELPIPHGVLSRNRFAGLSRPLRNRQQSRSAGPVQSLSPLDASRDLD